MQTLCCLNSIGSIDNRHYIEIFNRGKTPFSYSIESEKPWLKASKTHGDIESEERIWVSIDWGIVPDGKQTAGITVTGPQNRRIIVRACIDNSLKPLQDDVKEFIESNGYVSIEAEHFTKSVEAPPVGWLKIPGLGRTSFCNDVRACSVASPVAGRSKPSSRIQNVSFERV